MSQECTRCYKRDVIPVKDKVTWVLSFLRIQEVNVLTIMNRNYEPSLKEIRFPNLRDSLGLFCYFCSYFVSIFRSYSPVFNVLLKNKTYYIIKTVVMNEKNSLHFSQSFNNYVFKNNWIKQHTTTQFDNRFAVKKKTKSVLL